MQIQDKARFISILSFIFAGMAALFLWFWISYYQQKVTSFQKIDVVSQYEHVFPEQIKAIVEQNLTGGFFSLDVNALKEGLMADPWIASVSVRKLWPDTLVIDIKEQQAIARWNGTHVINDKDQLFSPAMYSISPALPSLTGPDDKQQLVLQQFHHFNQMLMLLGLSLQRLDLSPTLSWRFVLNNGIIVELGRDEIQKRFNRLVSLYSRLLGGRASQVAYIDLRYPNGLAIKWKTVQS